MKQYKNADSTSTDLSSDSPPRGARPIHFTPALLFAFFSIYVIWGSTYLAIRFGLTSFPPWTMSGVRFAIAAALMALMAKWVRRERGLTWPEAKIAVVSGIFMVCANGLVCVVEQWIPSGTVALLIGVMPIWVLMLGWAFFGHGKPALHKILGALIGLVGVALIAWETSSGPGPTNWLGFALLILSNVFWATATLVQRRLVELKSQFFLSSLQMVSGAAVALVLAFALEDPLRVAREPIVPHAWFALGYLIVFGSVVGYTAYSYLSRTVESHLVSTHALVNPLIAVWLGWLIGAEPITLHFLLATVVVLVGLSLLLKPSASVTRH